jgi:LAS superfamily LD-carboxypeptidase LdcB
MKRGAKNMAIGENNLSLLQEYDVFGFSDQHLVSFSEPDVKVHPQLIPALSALTQKAANAGFDMRIASGFRSFERQLLIWNRKASGVRPVLDKFGQPIDLNSLKEYQQVFAILGWSALPGASRHHWGTDIDVYDASRMPADYQLQLTLEETRGDGYCAAFHRWLTHELQRSPEGFFRPYVAGVGGIAPEPWHLSYAPLARSFATQLTEARLRNIIKETDIACKGSILKNLRKIFNKYIKPYQ